MKPTLIVYGDCQARALAQATAGDPVTASAYDVRHVQSPAPWIDEAVRSPEPQAWARCAVLWTELGVDPPDAALLASLPGDVRTASFPALWLRPPWAFVVVDPAFRDVAGYWYGKYPYSDSILLALCDSRADGPDLLVEYERLAARKIVVLDRMLERNFEMLAEREAPATVQVGRFIAENFRDINLFSAPAHPRPTVLRYLLDGLAECTWADPGLRRLGSRSSVLRVSDPLRMYDFPICRSVAECLGLRWWTEDLLYRVKDSEHASRNFTFAEYVLAYVRDRRALLAGKAA